MKYWIFFLLGSLLSIATYSQQWPLSEPEILMNFGGIHNSTITTGLWLESDKPDVMAISDGLVVFRRRMNSRLSVLPSGNGHILALEHEGGIRSLYAGFLDYADSFVTDSSFLSQGTVFAYLKPYSEGSLYFEVHDAVLSSTVNPLAILPTLSDAVLPVLVSLDLLGENSLRLSRNNQLMHGLYAVSVSAYDLVRQRGQRLSPYSFSVYINGVKQLSREFLYFPASSSVYPAELQMQDPEEMGSWILGNIEFLPGEASLELYIGDYYGNERRTQWLITVE